MVFGPFLRLQEKEKASQSCFENPAWSNAAAQEFSDLRPVYGSYANPCKSFTGTILNAGSDFVENSRYQAGPCLDSLQNFGDGFRAPHKDLFYGMS
jgi:hypothetical protein